MAGLLYALVSPAVAFGYAAAWMVGSLVTTSVLRTSDGRRGDRLVLVEPAGRVAVSLESADGVDSYPDQMNLEFSGEMWFWKGPAPWHFITVPERECGGLEATSALVTYGWGMIPVTAQIGGTGWKTSLFPKDGQYIVPVKAWVRKAEGLEVGDIVTVHLAVNI